MLPCQCGYRYSIKYLFSLFICSFVRLFAIDFVCMTFCLRFCGLLLLLGRLVLSSFCILCQFSFPHLLCLEVPCYFEVVFLWFYWELETLMQAFSKEFYLFFSSFLLYDISLFFYFVSFSCFSLASRAKSIKTGIWSWIFFSLTQPQIKLLII